jgi:hypothetical protein
LLTGESQCQIVVYSSGNRYRSESEGLLSKLWSKCSIFPTRNKIRKKAIESYGEVVKAEVKLAHNLVELEKAKGRLRDADIEIEEEHLRRLKNLYEARKEALEAERKVILETKLGSRKERIAEYKIDLEEAELLEKLQQIGKIEAPHYKPKPKTQADRISERSRQEEKIKEAIAKNREKELINIDKQARREGLSPKEMEEKKDRVVAHWAKREMDELEKLEKKFGYR